MTHDRSVHADGAPTSWQLPSFLIVVLVRFGGGTVRAFQSPWYQPNFAGPLKKGPSFFYGAGKLAFKSLKSVIIFWIRKAYHVAQTDNSAGPVFPQFSREDELTLISLPYRVGLYVSFADTSGGFEAQEAELQSLSNILREFAEDYCKSEFSQKVLMETLRVRHLWPSWSQGIESVPEQARHIIDLLEVHFDDRALRAFKEVLVEIAMAVAMAFREDDSDAAQPRFSALGQMLGGLFSRFRQPAAMGHTNISKNERAALMRLCKAMSYQMS